MKKITYRKLQARGACKYHVAIFKATWPEGIEPSLAAFRKAAELQLDLTWFMRSLLRGSPQLVAFNDARAAARKAHRKTLATVAWEFYKEMTKFV